MYLINFCTIHVLLALSLVSTPVFAQSPSEGITEGDTQNTGEDYVLDQVETEDNTPREIAVETVITSPQRPRSNAVSRTDNTDKYLGILGLLFLWLLTRKENERKEDRVRPERKAPVTADELGRAIYAVARSGDLTGFRTLHIDGKEAGDALGIDDATQYLRNRTQDKLTQDMAELSNRIPMGAQYKSCKIDGEKTIITLITSLGDLVEIDAGKAMQVGAILRLV
tara:strand:+ start:460 stop:1134 length:675 start_codon:yes stop_codon:yes gene_type:complete